MMHTLCLLALAAGVYTNPVPTPPPFETKSDAPGALGVPTCTTVLTSTVTGFQGDFTAEVARTIYTKTVTEYSPVDCGGCALSITTARASFWGGIGPQQIITATTTARHASTTTLTVCDGHPTPPTHGQIPRAEEEEEASSSGQCTYTKVIVPSPHALGDGEKTVYTTTATTTTSHIDCGGCNFLAVSTADYLHPGPMVHYTGTVTASTPAAGTAYVCLKSPSVVLPPSTTSHGTRPSAPTTLTPPPLPVPTGVVVTVTETLTRTAYAGTVTLVKTATCGPRTGSGPWQTSQGAIPDLVALDTETRTARPETETVYETRVVSTSASWTMTSFQCAGRKPTLTVTPIPMTGLGGGVGEVGDREVAKTTRPPTRPSMPGSPTGTTITVSYPRRG
jgi:hypothetical protein